MFARMLFLGVFVASGASALLYQVIWQRLLIFTTGADVRAVTIVIAAFMAGLGLGSLIGGHVADRLDARRRLWAFAACEAGIGLFATISAPLFYDVLYARLAAAQMTPAAMALLSFTATLWPTILMGMSLPLASRILTEQAHEPARWVPVLYGWNTLGAAAGAIGTLALMRQMDFGASLRIGAAANGLVAVVAAAMALSRPRAAMAAPSAAAGADRPPPDPAVSPGPHLPLSAWIAVYALTGCIALSLEVVWFRVLASSCARRRTRSATSWRCIWEAWASARSRRTWERCGALRPRGRSW